MLLKICKIFGVIIFASNALAQETFIEKNLPDKTQKPTSQTISSSPINTASDSITNILLNQKLTSLMFSDKENDGINHAISALKSQEIFTLDSNEDGANSLNNEKSYLFLASIIYYSPNDWAVWINDQKIIPTTNSPTKEIYLKSVQRDRVKIIWKIALETWQLISGKSNTPNLTKDNQVPVEFELRPNQTFVLTSNSVFEGKAIMALLNQNKKAVKAQDLQNNLSQ